MPGSVVHGWYVCPVIGEAGLRLEERDRVLALTGLAADRFGLVDEYLVYLADRNYSPKTVRAYGYDLLAFCRWLVAEEQPLAAVTTEVLLRFLRACREATVPGRPGPRVRMSGPRMDQYAAATVNRRLAAISGLFAFVALRDSTAPNPVPQVHAAHDSVHSWARVWRGSSPRRCRLPPHAARNRGSREPRAAMRGSSPFPVRAGRPRS